RNRKENRLPASPKMRRSPRGRNSQPGAGFHGELTERREGDRDMVIPTRSYGWLWLFLAASAAWAPGAGALAGDAPRQEAASRLDAPALAGLIDKSIQDRLSAEKATVAPLADDAEFVRRAY